VKWVAIVSAVVALGLAGCSGETTSDESSGSGPSDLEQKVYQVMSDVLETDASGVHCYETGNDLGGLPLARCEFDDGTTPGCYNAETGEDLTVPGRSPEPKIPECWP
jgi:hypothetical protein